MLRRIGLRGLDPSLFERPKTGFVRPFDRWIRCGLKDAMDRSRRAGLSPEAPPFGRGRLTGRLRTIHAETVLVPAS